MTRLSTEGGRFCLDGRPAFLYGVSYYAGLGASEDTVRRDLDDMGRHGFNWLRVWATWAAFGDDVSAVDDAGRPREPFLSRLVWLVGECDERDLVCDVTLSRGNGATGPPRLQTLDAHLRAAETLVAALAGRRNWYLDIANERNIDDPRHVTVPELAELRAAAKALDRDLLVTASHALRDVAAAELRDYILALGLDVLCPHRPRHAASPTETEAVSRAYVERMGELGRVVPLHYQEPFRRGHGSWEPCAEDFAADLEGALRGGAAGWCFHNGAQGGSPGGAPRRSFDLRRSRLFDQLDEEERRALALLAQTATAWPLAADS